MQNEKKSHKFQLGKQTLTSDQGTSVDNLILFSPEEGNRYYVVY